MEINYFDDTDTLLIVFNKRAVASTEDINEQMVVDLDAAGNPVALTIEHARSVVNLNAFSFQHIPAQNLPVTV